MRLKKAEEGDGVCAWGGHADDAGTAARLWRAGCRVAPVPRLCSACAAHSQPPPVAAAPFPHAHKPLRTLSHAHTSHADALSSGAWSAGLPSSPAALAESGEFWMLLAAQSMAVGTIMIRCGELVLLLPCVGTPACSTCSVPRLPMHCTHLLLAL